jgi:cytochrome c oxidase subunit 2
MKKILIFLMAITVVMALAACGAKEEAPAAGTSASPAAAGQQVTLKATNFQFDQKEYKVKKGQPVTITLDNSQGVHGAAITEFNVKVDNNKKTVTFTPDKAGSYPIICSIMCGTGHAAMKSTLIVEE